MSLFRVVGIVGLLIFTSCAQHKTRPLPPDREFDRPSPSFIEHTINYSGETLADIAAWYTGSAKNWKAIQDSNPGVRPDRLRLGQVLKIPSEIVVNNRPFPKSGIKRKSPTVTTTSQSSTQLPPSQEPKAESSPAESSTLTPDPALTPVDNAPVEPTASPPAELAPTSAPSESAPSPAESAPSAGDADREKLLDELLK